jgi:predicted HTH domain antitoxin
MQITLNVPEQFLIDAEPGELARRIQLYAAVLMFQSGELSAGAAAEFAAVERFTFLAECQRRGIATVNYPAEELAEEVAALR